MNKYSVWLEGYSATGESSPAVFWGNYEAENFPMACEKATEEGADPSQYNQERNTYWGCHFYDNETEARKTIG